MPNVALAGPYNTFIPNARASGNLFVDFSRNKEDFKVNKYVQIVPTENMIGIWYQMGLDQRARVLDSAGAKYTWQPGTNRPEAHDQGDYFSELAFRCRRRSYPDVLDLVTNEQAAWNLREQRSRELAQLAMTFRTMSVLAKLTDSAQYATSHVLDLSTSAFTGQTGNWAASTSARQTIKRTLNYAKETILLDTRGAVKSEDLLIVMSPSTAAQISVSQEIVELVKNSSNGLVYLQNKSPFSKSSFGLPDRLYDTEYVIEDTVYVSTQRGLITQTAAFVLALGTVLILHRPNSLEGVEGGRSFSTVSMHIYRGDDMKMESKRDEWNRVEHLAVTDNFDVNMTAPVSGMLLTNVC